MYIDIDMCILMYMHIYISKANEEWLRKQEGSMSGIINDLLYERRGTSRLDQAKELFVEHVVETQQGVSSLRSEPKKPGNIEEWQTIKRDQGTTAVNSASLTRHKEILDKPLSTDTKDYSLCKHGQVKGFCKSGCK